eukprot:TRINITY_DN2835_c11_g1_i1.p1 TRINITY_DN2835_c11_g1~~TRINITY_DN2835_c11_g1_i1.p1  ORF type:complete len:707 (+),score=126.15 TRINITY_DN2835_c11_g1_i1:83-2122(+)
MKRRGLLNKATSRGTPTVEIPNQNFVETDDRDEKDEELGARASTPLEVESADASPRTEMNASPTSSQSPYASPKAHDTNNECVICLEALSDVELAPICCLTKSSQRVCRHYFHMHCAQRIRSVDGKGYGEKVQTFYTDSVIKTCPNCRSEFDGVKEVPNPKLKPREWFAVMDYSQQGKLSKEDAVDAVATTIDIEINMLYEILQENWLTWDPDDTGYVKKDSINTLINAICKKIPPFLPEDPIGWFQHWDVEGKDELTKEQVSRAVATTLQSDESEAMELVENIWCLFDMENPNVITKKQFLEPRGLSDTLCASLAEDPRFKSRVTTALTTPKNSKSRANSIDPLCAKPPLEVGMRVRIMSEIGTPRYKWGRVRPGDIGTIRSIDRITNTARVDFAKHPNWRGCLPELEKVPAYLDTYKPWQVGDEVQVLRDLARAKQQQDDRSNWVSSMDATCGKVGKIVVVMPQERKVKVKLPRGTFVYVMENVLRPGVDDPPRLVVGMKVRVKAEVPTPKYQWGNVSPGDVGIVTASNDGNLTCQVSFPRHHDWKGYQPDMEVVEEAPVEDVPSAASSPASSPKRVRVGAHIRVKPSVVTPRFAWGRIKKTDIGVVTAVERTRELVTVDFPTQRNWIGLLTEMETVRVRPPTVEWSCPACTYVNPPEHGTCDMCDGQPPHVVTDSD